MKGLLAVWLLAWAVWAETVDTLSYEILSEGEEIQVDLQDYFQYASFAQINEDKSSGGYKEVLDIEFSQEPYRQVSMQPMEVLYNKKKIRMSEHPYLTTKSFYNQPAKVFLLDNNFLLMYIYSDQLGDQSRVIGLNLTETLPSYLKSKKVQCSNMEAQTISNMDIIYVSCRAEDSPALSSFFVVSVNMTHNKQGFIDDMRVAGYYSLLNKTNTCLEYGLKYFDKIQLERYYTYNKVFAFCKQRTAASMSSDSVFYFERPNMFIFNSSFKPITRCLVNSSYISATENGFLSVINKRVFEYYYNRTTDRWDCLATDLDDLDYVFAASRSYNNIQITYLFLRNNTIIIKSSYRTNHQKLFVNRPGYRFTSYALTEHFMSLSMQNPKSTLLLVYDMEELYPRLIDDRFIDNANGTLDGSVLISTGNYLEKGYFVFFYERARNQISLNSYNGYIVYLRPKTRPGSTTVIALHTDRTRKLPISKRELKNIRKKHSKLKFHSENSTSYRLCIESNTEQESEQLIVNVVVRNFSDPNIVMLPREELRVGGPYVNLNLSSMAIGPLLRFYLQAFASDKTHEQFINYYSTINISNLIDPVGSPRTVQLTGSTLWPIGWPGTVQKLKQMALNMELKIQNPALTLYYGSFIQTCLVKYLPERVSFELVCHPEDIILYRTNLQANSKVIVLSKDKWLQYDHDLIEFCSIVGQSGQCEFLELGGTLSQGPINKIKLVKFEAKTGASTYIEIFVLYDDKLEYGYFLKYESESKAQFGYYNIFTITVSEVKQFGYMKLTNVHYDRYYSNYLLLHFSTAGGAIIKHSALLYDRPNLSDPGKFLGHLMKVFDSEQIESIMTIDSLIIIVQRLQSGDTIISEYKVTEYFSVYPTRMYPLYSRKLVQNGTHVSDGEFLYLEAEVEVGPRAGLTEYLVYCPSMSATNILTHIIPKESVISFIQEIGSSKNKYPHSIGVNGDHIFALSIPNLALKFDLESRTLSSGNAQPVEEGSLNLKLIDYLGTMHQMAEKYIFNISEESIEYSPASEVNLLVNSSSPSSTYSLELQKIGGPVMQYSLSMGTCPFLQGNVQFEDIFTKMQCLINIDSKQFGTLLDVKSMSLSIGKSVEIIVTTDYLICVENKKISSRIELPVSKACYIANNQDYKALIVCDEGQGSVIHLLELYDDSCLSYSFTQQVAKPKWLIYQYFKMKFNDPYAIFQVPIRIESNKIYFIAKFNIEKKQFSEQFLSLTHKEMDHFLSMDFDIDEGYAYVLEEGLGIYPLFSFETENETAIEPLAWISNQNMARALGTDNQLVYIKPEMELEDLKGPKCSTIFSNSIHMEVGTEVDAYKVKICFNDDELELQYEIVTLIVYKQYKDCKNNALSKSKTWGGLTLKLCILELEEHRIFSNYMPIFSKSSEYYMQFYAVDSDKSFPQAVHPFRMEKITTNDTFEIKQFEGQLIVRSLFNFMCYYQLDTGSRWTVRLRQGYPLDSARQCIANLTFENENFVRNFTLTFINTDPLPQEAFKPWIFRGFFTFVLLLSGVKYRRHLLNNSKSQHRIRNNIMTNQFEFKVRVNSKKSLEVDLLDEDRVNEEQEGSELNF